MSTSSVARRVLQGGVAVVSAGVLLVSAGGWWTTNHFNDQIQRTTVFSPTDDDPSPEARPTVDPRAGDSVNILVVGSDNRDGLSKAERRKLHVGQKDYGERTDTMMIVHIGKDTSHVSVVGLPRDSLVTIPAYKDSDGVKHAALRTRINEAFPRGGGRLMVKTVEQATGVHIDHYVEVNFRAFLGMVDALDGVDVCLVKPLKDNPKYTKLDLPAGKSTLRGATALDFVRSRHVDSDFGRIQRQQQFITAMLQKATNTGVLANPVKLNEFISSALKNTKVDETLDRDALLDLAGRMQGIKFNAIEFPRIPIEDAGYTDPVTGIRDLVKWSDSGAEKLFEAIRTDTPISASAKAAAKGSDAVVATVPPSAIRVSVIDATGTAGTGKKALKALDKLGYQTVGPVTTSKKTYTNTVIRYDATFSETVKTLQLTFPGAVLKPVPGLGRTIQVVVGSGYTGVTKPKIKTLTGTAASIDSTIASDTACAT
ncbi:MAG: LCP family protein [Candidatus Nanopelagicales bacterium]